MEDAKLRGDNVIVLHENVDKSLDITSMGSNGMDFLHRIAPKRMADIPMPTLRKNINEMCHSSPIFCNGRPRIQ